MDKKQILIVEDEAPIRDMVRFILETENFSVVESEDGKAAMAILASETPDLILVDWMLPSQSGIELVRKLRKDELTRNIPIVMLTARAEEEHRLKGFETGADDYIVKPFSPRELVARIKAVLRRGPLEEVDSLIEFESLVIDTASHQVSIDGCALTLGPTEYRLLKFFVTHQRRVYSREQLLHHVWGPDTYIEDRTVDVHIRRLRKLLKPFDYEKYLHTVRSVGYRFSKE